MAKFVSKYVQDAMCSWIGGTTFPAVPTHFYVALVTTAPSDTSGTALVEVSGGSYARQILGSMGSNSTSGSGTTSVEQNSQSSTLTFPTATANWGTIVGVAIYDALTTGNLIAYGDLSASQTVNNGNTFTISTSNLTFQA